MESFPYVVNFRGNGPRPGIRRPAVVNLHLRKAGKGQECRKGMILGWRCRRHAAEQSPQGGGAVLLGKQEDRKAGSWASLVIGVPIPAFLNSCFPQQSLSPLSPGWYAAARSGSVGRFSHPCCLPEMEDANASLTAWRRRPAGGGGPSCRDGDRSGRGSGRRSVRSGRRLIDINICNIIPKTF